MKYPTIISMAIFFIAILDIFSILIFLHKLGIPRHLYAARAALFVYKNKEKFEQINKHQFTYDRKLITFETNGVISVHHNTKDQKYIYSCTINALHLTAWERRIITKTEIWLFRKNKS